MVSDAGTPTISDPGYPLLQECIKADVSVVPIPGASAILAAATVSGLPLHNFSFEGFLSPKSGKRKRQLSNLANEKRTIILFESPHRIYRLLEDLFEVMGDRDIVIARELTKRYEETFRGSTSQALEKFRSSEPRGEFTVVIGSKQNED